MVVFIVGSMAAMGLSLTVKSIVEPLRDLRMVVLLLTANFVAVPLVAIGAARFLPMDGSASTAVIIIGCCAGAPFLPKLTLMAKGSPAFAVGGMVLLMVATVIYVPIVVPLVVEGATVDPWDIASSLIVLMLIPLGIGLFVKARYEDLADSWVGTAGQTSSVGLLIGIVAALLVTWRDILGAIGSWIFIGTAIVLVAGLFFGYLASYGRAKGDMKVTAFASALRNISAAIVVAGSIGGDTIVLTLVSGLGLTVILIVLAGEIGKRAEAASPADTGSGDATLTAAIG